MRLKDYEGESAERYVVKCEDCGLTEEYNQRKPPRHIVEYWGTVSKARQNWSALSGAKGKRDGHTASTFVDYEDGIRHNAYIEVVECD